MVAAVATPVVFAMVDKTKRWNRPNSREARTRERYGSQYLLPYENYENEGERGEKGKYSEWYTPLKRQTTESEGRKEADKYLPTDTYHLGEETAWPFGSESAFVDDAS